MAANVRNTEDAALDGVENFGLRVHEGLALLRNSRGRASVGGSRSGTRHRWVKEGVEETGSRWEQIIANTFGADHIHPLNSRQRWKGVLKVWI
jgi:hypothetical protein